MGGFKITDLFLTPAVNPINRKARAIPLFNVVNVYGRVFFFAWFGFMVAFWAWYAFPPLLTATIKADLNLSATDIANSNIVSLCATLLVRAVSGPLCDNFGPRKVFAAMLLVGAIPIGLAPLIQNVSGLYAIRFFVGILGGTFVPCLVWSTGFFDKNVVGTANAMTGGFGNAGGGLTYFIMPAVYDSLIARGYVRRAAWRITFVAPLVLLIVVGLSLFFLCPDTPDGSWSERVAMVDVPGRLSDKEVVEESSKPGTITEKRPDFDHEGQMTREEMLRIAQGEVIVAPTASEAVRVMVSPQTLFHILTYLCSFGAELAINATLASYYVKNFPALGQTGAANWAAMWGFLNVVTRPLGGIISDVLYDNFGHSLWLKKGWILLCGVLGGISLIIVGKLDSHDQSTMFGLIGLAAIFIEAGNGANFSLVPHVHPYANGIVSGLTGAGGNLGGVIFAIIFRFLGDGTEYAEAFWVIGVIHIVVNVAVSWIPPIPKGQVGGR